MISYSFLAMLLFQKKHSVENLSPASGDAKQHRTRVDRDFLCQTYFNPVINRSKVVLISLESRISLAVRIPVPVPIQSMSLVFAS